VLLLPARGTRLKGHHAALDLLARLRADGVDARLWLLGIEQAGREPYVREIEAYADRLGLDGVVACSPPRPDIAFAYAASEVVLSLGALTAMGLLLMQRFRGGTELLSREAWALTTALFFCYWLPELFSATDALDGARTWKEVATDLRYLPFLWLVAMAMGT